jgi:peptidyl-prolyl cis-trans isomerase A (cyclophilin A)
MQQWSTGRLGFFLLACVFWGCHSVSDPDKPHVVIKTPAGDIEVEVYLRQAPRTAGAFLSYVDSGFYRNASFYRILNAANQPTGANDSKLIQGGIWRTDHARAVAVPGVPHETTRQTRILHTDGTISLARGAPGTGTTEFFICIGTQPGYDFGGENNPDGQGYAAFGKVVRGMDVVRAIYESPENDQSFTPPIPILDITRK